MTGRTLVSPTDELHRRSRRLALQVVVLIVALLAAVALLALWLYERTEHRELDATLRAATATYTPADAPPGFWVLLEQGSTRTQSGPTPSGLPDERDLAAVAADGRARQHEFSADDRQYFVRTAAREDGVVQVVVDRTSAETASGRLVRALLLASAIGVLLAGAVAAALTRRLFNPLTDALTMQRRFVSDASHELRTPVTLLSTRVQLLSRRLARDPSTSDDVRRDLDGVVADTRALGDLLDELLVAAEPGLEREVGPVDLPDLVGSVVAAASAAAAERGLRLDTGALAPVVVEVSEPAVRRALTALVDNALDHAAHAVRVTVVAGRRTVEVAVADDGPGVPPEVARRMFERFASTRAEDAEPTGRRHYGLGLALVADVALAHHGRVEVRAAEGGGAVLVLVLPL